MYKRLQNMNGKNIDAGYKAAEAMVTGRLVQKHGTNGTAILPASQINLFLVGKDTQPTGLMSYEGEISESDTRLTAIAINDFVTLEKPMIGERFATDQFVSTSLVVGCNAEVSVASDATKGKMIYKSSASEFLYLGTMVIGTTTLAMFEVLAPI